MPKEYQKPMRILLILGALTVFIDYRIAAGYLLGGFASILLYIRNDRYWNRVLDGGSATKYTGIFHFLVNYLIMAAVLLAGALLPGVFNIFACTIGLFLFKFSVILKETLFRN